MTAQVFDGTVAILWGSATRELNWIHLDPKQGTVSVARAHPGGFWVRDYGNLDDIDIVAAEAYDSWVNLRVGVDMSFRATHRLAPPHLQIIELLPKEATP